MCKTRTDGTAQTFVIPAKAGIHAALTPDLAVRQVDSRFRGNDDNTLFLRRFLRYVYTVARSQGLLTTTLLSLLPLPAFAQEAMERAPDINGILGADPQALVAAGVGALLAGLAAVPVLLAQRRQLKHLTDDQTTREIQLERVEEVLTAAPDGFFRWDSDGAAHCSRRLAVLLGLYKGLESAYTDVLEAFGLSEAAVLEVAVAGLRQNGVGFEIELAVRDGRRMQVTGVRAATHDGDALADVLWMRDVTEGSLAVDQLSQEAMDLAAQRDRLQAVLDALPIPVWVRDDDLALLYVNRAYAEAVDAAGTEAAVEAGTELVAGPAVREARALAARSRAAGTARSEGFHLVVGGSRRLLEITEVPVVVGPAGTGLVTAGFALDQTRIEEADSELARHVAAHAEVLENLGTAIAIFSTDTRLTFHNTAFRRLWALEDDWLAGQPNYASVLDVLRERRRLPEVADWRAFRDEEVRRFTSLLASVEDLLHLPDGTTLRRVISPHPFGGLLMTYEDVTDTLALERSYNVSVAVQRETIDNLHEGVAVFGSDGRLRLWNPAYARIWSLESDELKGGPHITEVIGRHRRFFAGEFGWQRVHDALLDMFQTRRPAHGRVERQDGAILDYTSVPLPDGSVLKTWLDVTDTAKVERALRERNEALRAADRLKSEFIANVSCEVRQPLNAIIGFAEILANGYYGDLNKRQMEYAHGITEAGRTLQSLVADILDLATIEAGQMTLELGAFDIHTMLANVLALTRETARSRNLTIHFDCPLDIGWMVADERRIKQVLFNLLNNAIKFTPPKGQITLAAQRDTDQIVFTVADTGIGFPPQELAQAFDRFWRGAQSEARQGGAGLGLSLVKSFIELHGGCVEIVSVPSEGTTVTCRLPAGRADVAEG